MLKFTLSPLLKQYAAVIVVNLSVLVTGLGLAWPSPVLVKLRNETQTVLSRPISEEDGSWMVSIGFLTALLSNFLPAYLVDKIGRKCTVILACLPKLIAFFLFTFASEVWMLLLGRGILGIVDSMTFTVVPMYASEIASKEVRGSLGTIMQIVCSMGILTMLSMGPFVPYVPLNIIVICVTIISVIPLLFLPDSPYFLYSKGRIDEALKVLIQLRGSEELAKGELKEYASSTTEVKVDKRELFSNRIFLKATGIVIILGVGGQLIGFNAVSFYLQTVLESTRTSIRPEVASVIIGMIQLIASFCTAFITDRFGRKPILAASLVAMSIGMVGLGSFFKIRETTDTLSGVMNYVPIVSLILVVYGFSAGPGSLYWMIVTELFEGPARAVGVSCKMIVTTIFLFLTTKYFPLVTNTIGAPFTYWIFGVNCALLCIFILFCVPETKGKTFSEIQVALGAKRMDDVKLSKVVDGVSEKGDL